MGGTTPTMDGLWAAVRPNTIDISRMKMIGLGLMLLESVVLVDDLHHYVGIWYKFESDSKPEMIICYNGETG